MKTRFLLAICFVVLISFYGCQQNAKESNIQEGKQLAAQHCGSCHLLPEPNWVDSKTWEKGILPMMGPRLGVFYYQGKRYPVNKYDFSLPSNFYPDKPVITEEQWQKIIDYYVSMAPAKNESKQVRKYPIKNELALFTAISPATKTKPPSTSFVKIDEASPAYPFIISDAMGHSIYRYDKNLKQFDSINTKGPVVDIELNKTDWLTCDIGILNPDNGKNGSVKKLLIGPGDKFSKEAASPVVDLLQRPVQIKSVDLNQDGKMDLLVCEFGYLTGSFSWMENTGNGKYEKHILRALPGAIKTIVDDYNHDGLPDIWVLCAQGDEGIFLYTNLGNGKFSEKQILRFPSINGSSSFELVDMNHDGYKDIIYTCGDNADYSTVLKSYHGVYIFLNDGKNQFTQKYFFPLNGCYKAIARDFDNDGDLDIATISYFADFETQPEEGFVYLENQGNLDFKPYSLPATLKGRWLTMDAGDFDQDGKIDLILGNFSLAPSFKKSKVNWKQGPPFMILKNIGTKK